MSKYDKHFAEKHEIYIYKPKVVFVAQYKVLHHSEQFHVSPCHCFLPPLKPRLSQCAKRHMTARDCCSTPTAHRTSVSLPAHRQKLKDFLLFLRCCTTFHQPIHFLPTRLLFTPRPVTDKYSIKKLHQRNTMKQQHPVVRCNPSCQKLARLQEKCNSFMGPLWILFKCWDRIPHLWYCRYQAGVIIWFDTVIRKSTPLAFWPILLSILFRFHLYVRWWWCDAPQHPLTRSWKSTVTTRDPRHTYNQNTHAWVRENEEPELQLDTLFYLWCSKNTFLLQSSFIHKRHTSAFKHLFSVLRSVEIHCQRCTWECICPT